MGNKQSTSDSSKLNSEGSVRSNSDNSSAKPSKDNNSVSTESICNGIESHLSSLQQSVRTIRHSNPQEAQQQLMKEICDTEKKLTYLKQQLQHQEKSVGKSTFYIHQDEDEDNENLLVSTILSHNDKLQLENEKMRIEKENLCVLLRESEEKNEKEEAKNAELLLRLSKVAGERLVEDNPAITDLSDQKRPTKLGEIYSELYDNEWTDALEDLTTEGYEDEFAISTLLLTFINVLDFCKQKAETMLAKTEDAMNFLFEDYKLIHETKQDAHFMTMSRQRLSLFKFSTKLEDIKLYERWKKKSKIEDTRHSVELKVKKPEIFERKIKGLRKETAELMVPVVQKAYLKTTWRNGEFVPALKPFIRKCIFVCWMMVVQSPPMCVHDVEMKENVKFDKNYFREYTASGVMVKFVVWPALLLHENGPVVCKEFVPTADLDTQRLH